MKMQRVFHGDGRNGPGLGWAPGASAAQAARRWSVHAQPQLVIIDTDIGDDIDDAFALALALRSPELHILGVTTTFGDTELRARLLDRYLAAVGPGDIPVAAGPATKTRQRLDPGRLCAPGAGAEACRWGGVPAGARFAAIRARSR